MTPIPWEWKYAVSAWEVPAATLPLSSPNSFSLRVARPAGFQNAASPRPSSVTAVCPMPTAAAPTGSARKRAPALLTSWAGRRSGGRAVRSSATARTRPPSEVLRFIDQHDGNVVFDRVDKAAGAAHQLFARRGAMFERPLALGADEDFQQVGRKAHPAYPRRLSESWSRRHFGHTLTCSSRNTWVSSRASILRRAAVPSAWMVRPPSPITMPF